MAENVPSFSPQGDFNIMQDLAGLDDILKSEFFEDDALLSQIGELPMDFDLDNIQNSPFLDPATLSPNDSAYQSDASSFSSSVTPQLSPKYQNVPDLTQNTSYPDNNQSVVNQLPSLPFKTIQPNIQTQASQPSTVLMSSVSQKAPHVVYSALPIQSNQHIILQQSQQVPNKKTQNIKQNPKGPLIQPVVLQAKFITSDNQIPTSTVMYTSPSQNSSLHTIITTPQLITTTGIPVMLDAENKSAIVGPQ